MLNKYFFNSLNKYVEKWIIGWWGKEEVCYWLSNDIVGLVGNLAV